MSAHRPFDGGPGRGGDSAAGDLCEHHGSHSHIRGLGKGAGVLFAAEGLYGGTDIALAVGGGGRDLIPGQGAAGVTQFRHLDRSGLPGLLIGGLALGGAFGQDGLRNRRMGGLGLCRGGVEYTPM